jgi:phage-related protein
VINLYDSTETDFSHNGLVVLSDCQAAFVEEELNGKYELELEYPIDGRGKWAYLIEGNILKSDGQLFRIYHKEKTLTGIKVSARHISMIFWTISWSVAHWQFDAVGA